VLHYSASDDSIGILKLFFILSKIPMDSDFDIPVFNFFAITMISNALVGGRRGRDRMVVGFTITCAISAYHHLKL